MAREVRQVAGFPVGEYYQDLWIKGECIESGPRECEERYARVAEFCSQYKRPFTVLDWGAQMGYFSLRLTEEFDCTVVAVERDFNLLGILKANENERVIFLNLKMTPEQFRLLAKVEHFDVVLALSVVHHNRAAKFDQWIEILRSLGDWLIMEIANDPGAVGKSLMQTAKQAYVPPGATLMGATKAHFGTMNPRPMFSMHTPGKRLTWPFIGCSAQTRGVPCGGFDVASSFESKTNHKGEDWIRGINLRTYMEFNGKWPTRDRIIEQLKRHGEPQEGHGDVGPHNVIISGDDSHLIDGFDGHGKPERTSQGWKNLIAGAW